MTKNSITVLCVDDNPAVASSLRSVVEAEPDMIWLGHVPAADDLLETVEDLMPHVVLIDLAMPGRNAFEAIRDLHEQAPTARVIVLSGFVNSGYVSEAMDCGAWGYIAKHEGPQVVLDAIRRVAVGEVAFPSHTG